MAGTFTTTSDAETELFDWGQFAWHSRPKTIGAQALIVAEVIIKPGAGHDFHLHPNQEEVIYVIDGEIEQWLEQKRQVLGAGDSVFVPRNTVHASFNETASAAKVVAILGPCVGEAGYELVDVSGEEPWNALRS